MPKSAANNRQRFRRNSSYFCSCCFASDTIADEHRREIDVDVDKGKKIAPLCLLLYLLVGLSRLSRMCITVYMPYSVELLLLYALCEPTLSLLKMSAMFSASGKEIHSNSPQIILIIGVNVLQTVYTVEQMNVLDLPCKKCKREHKKKKEYATRHILHCEG